MKNIKEVNVRIEGEKWNKAIDTAYTKASSKVN